jgi:alkylated DNA repair dioxygenase AlkB
MSSQASLFEIEPRALPPGMRYWEEVVSEAQEHSLVRFIEQLPLKPFEFAGGFKGNRRVVSFGWRYDYNRQTLVETSAIPKELDEIRRAVALLAGHSPEELSQALVTEYAPGAGIGWHRDKKMFGDIIGISLLTSCNFRLRLKKGTRLGANSIPGESAFCLSSQRAIAYALGAQHSAVGPAALFDHLSNLCEVRN